MTSKSGIEYPSSVDVITQTPTGEWKLIIVEDGAWDGSPERLSKLQQKLNNYLSFALDGQLVRLYPEAQGHKVAIQIDCYRQPDDDTLSFLESARERMKADGVALYVSIDPAVQA